MLDLQCYDHLLHTTRNVVHVRVDIWIIKFTYNSVTERVLKGQIRFENNYRVILCFRLLEDAQQYGVSFSKYTNTITKTEELVGCQLFVMRKPP